MLRLEPPKYQRLRQATLLQVRACGAQFNIAANMAAMGRRSAFLTKLPAHELGQLARSLAASYGIDTSHIKFVDNSKMGVVFVEFGVAPRRHAHIYDRVGSAASTMSTDDFSWSDILKDARLAYVDGIFPALNEGCREVACEFVAAAKRAGCTVCFDVNYRETLWEPTDARALYENVLPDVDILATNRSVAENVFGYKGSDNDILHCYHREFGCNIVCLTYREMQGVLKGRWRSLALHEGRVMQGQPFEFDVVDRFGTGDAFFAGFLFAYLERGDVQYALDFGNALCAMAHTIDGDVATFSPQEVEALLSEEYTLVAQR